jgi:hypothetical protein
MKSKEELEAVRDALEDQLEDTRINGTEFQKGLICGAFDAVHWALGKTTKTNVFFGHYAAMSLAKRKRRKKRVTSDAFAV